jgi:hypothetical protein
MVEGRKDDNEKDRWDLLPVDPIRQLVKVLTFGARKYADDNWMKVPGARRRYYSAAMRHLTAWYDGEQLDPESGLPTLAHALCCIVFLMGHPETKYVKEIKNMYNRCGSHRAKP